MGLDDFDLTSVFGRLELAQEISDCFCRNWNEIGNPNESFQSPLIAWLYLVKGAIALGLGLCYYDYCGEWLQDSEVSLFSFNGKSFYGLDGPIHDWDELIVPKSLFDWHCRVIHEFC